MEARTKILINERWKEALRKALNDYFRKRPAKLDGVKTLMRLGRSAGHNEHAAGSEERIIGTPQGKMEGRIEVERMAQSQDLGQIKVLYEEKRESCKVAQPTRKGRRNRHNQERRYERNGGGKQKETDNSVKTNIRSSARSRDSTRRLGRRCNQQSSVMQTRQRTGGQLLRITRGTMDELKRNASNVLKKGDDSKRNAVKKWYNTGRSMFRNYIRQMTGGRLLRITRGWVE